MDRKRFRYAIKRIWNRGTKQQRVEYFDTGSNSPDQANAVINDVRRMDPTALCVIVKAALPWDGKSAPRIITQ